MGCGGKLIAEDEKENPKRRHGLRYRAIRGTSVWNGCGEINLILLVT